jgi:putative chitinase
MLTPETVRGLYPRAAQDHVDAFAEKSGELFTRFGIAKSADRLHFFLAQIGHESAGLTSLEESLRYRADRIREVWPSRFPDITAARACEGDPERLANTVYCHRMGNGAPETGDGWTYRGRGYVQITGRDAYENIGRIAGLDLIDDPDLAASPAHALLVACAFWQWKGLNGICDTASYEQLTRRINGGLNGMRDRWAWLDKVRRALLVPPAEAEQPAIEEIIAVQRALQDRGYREVGAADGVLGPRTAAALARFRQKSGLRDGLIDDALKAALGIGPK